jgi:pimeloyl-ACP methyl ester carboxylesterase
MMTAPLQGVEVDHIEFPAGRIHFHHSGSAGPPVVLLHGAGLDNGMLSWRHTIPVLAADHRVYVPDLPGQGKSIPWRGRANQRTFEEALRWLLDAWGLQDAILVGRSMGGSIATGFALRYPCRVRGLVLAGSGGLQHRLDKHFLNYLTQRLPFTGSLAAKALGTNRSLVRRMLTRNVFTGSQPVRDLEEIVDEMLAEARSRGSVFSEWQNEAIERRAMHVNHLPHLGQIRCPTMVIHGERDEDVPLSASRDAAAAIPNSTLRIIPDTGSWPSREKPNEFNALLREFVNVHR